jgi:hypothetical protein
LPHSSGWDEENLQPQSGANDEPNLPREGAPERRNEEADQHAKAALQRKTYKTIAEDWKNWIREKQEGIRQAEWTSSHNPMITVKPRIKQNTGAQAPTRRDQVIITRLRMGYT